MEIAARYGQIECVYELLRHGLSIEESGASGEGICRHGSYIICSVCISDWACVYACTGVTDHIQLRGAQGGNNASAGGLPPTSVSVGAGSGSVDGNTPLLSAIRHCQVECVRELIALGANIYV